MKQIKTFALVLNRTNYGEADRIVNFITPLGKKVAMARGSRKQKSKLASGIEPFALNEVVFLEGKTDLYTLSSSRMVDFYRYILQDFSRTEFAYKAIKKINAYSENIDGGNFYDILLQTLISLNNQKNSLEIVEYWFELQLAFTIGEEVNLQYDNNSNKLDSSRNYNFDIYQKVFVEDINGRYSSEDIKFLRLMLTSTPSLISRVVGSAKILAKVKPIIESFIGR